MSVSSRPRATCLYLRRSIEWPKNAPGVAWTTPEVTTTPVAIPRASAFSRMVCRRFPALSSPSRELLVFRPVENAVPAAAESVTRLLAEWVFTNPVTGARSIWIGRYSFSIIRAVTWASPIPSPIIRIMFSTFSASCCFFAGFAANAVADSRTGTTAHNKNKDRFIFI